MSDINHKIHSTKKFDGPAQLCHSYKWEYCMSGLKQIYSTENLAAT